MLIGDLNVVHLVVAENERRLRQATRMAELRAQLSQDEPMRPSLARRIGRLINPGRAGIGQGASASASAC